MSMEKYCLPLRFVSGINLGVSVLSISVGIASLVVLDEYAWPVASGVGIWGAIIFIIQACLGLTIARCYSSDASSTATKTLWTAFMVFNGLCFSCCIQMMAYSGQAIAACADKPGEDKCVGNVAAILALNGAGVALGAVYLGIIFASYMIYALISCEMRKLNCGGCSKEVQG